MDQSRATSATPSSKQEKLRQIELKKQEKLMIELAAEKKQIRDHLTREENFKSLSNQRGWNDWKTFCGEVACELLREDLCAVSQSVTCFMDRSVHLVDTIKTHRSHAEEQYLRNFQKHSEILDYITDVFKVFKDSSNRMYDMEREKLINDFYVDAFSRDRLRHGRKVYYENLAHADVSMLKCRVKHCDEKFIDKKFNIAAESVVKGDDHMIKVKKVEAAACVEIRNLVNLFNNQLWPLNRFSQYQKALKRSIEVDAGVEELIKKSEESKKIVGILYEKLQTATREQLMKLSELKSEQNFLTKLTSAREEKMSTDIALDHATMLRLIVVCENQKKILKQKLEQGKKIQVTMEICSKHEKFSDSIGSFESLESFPQQACDEFFKKLARVEAQVVVLRSYKAIVTKENEKLRAEIKEGKHERELNHNMRMLRLDLSPSVGQICQISHQIPQIRTRIELRQRWKLCKTCKEFLCIAKTLNHATK